MTSIIINRLRKEDYYNGFLDVLEQLTIVEKDNISYQSFCDNIDNLNSDIFVIRNKLNDKIIATGTIFIEVKFIHNLGKVGHIEDIVVDEKYRGRGYGKMLIHYLTNYGKIKGCYKIILNCTVKNKNFYKKCGFEQKEIEMVKYL